MSSPLSFQIIGTLILQRGNVTFKIFSDKVGIEIAKCIEKIIDVVLAYFLNADKSF